MPSQNKYKIYLSQYTYILTEKLYLPQAKLNFLYKSLACQKIYKNVCLLV